MAYMEKRIIEDTKNLWKSSDTVLTKKSERDVRDTCFWCFWAKSMILDLTRTF